MICIKLGLQLLVGIGALLVVYLDYKWHDKRTKNFRRARNWLIAITILSFLVSFLTTVLDEENQQREIQNFNDKITNLENDNIRLREEITEITNELRNNITGGDSFCYIDITKKGRTGILIVLLEHVGSYTLQNVKVSISDGGRRRDMWSKKPRPDIEEMGKKTTYNFNVGSMPVNTLIELFELDPQAMYGKINPELTWGIQISADNGYFYQDLKYRKGQVGNITALRVRNQENEVIYEQVAEGFQLDSIGKPDWKKIME